MLPQTNMSYPIKKSIVRILNKNKVPIGSGFLVNETIVMTCAHVVNTALSRPIRSDEFPEALVSFDFPLLKPESFIAGKVSKWQPLLDNDSGDIACIELENPVYGAEPVILIGDFDDYWQHEIRAFGFPKGYQNGVWTFGFLREQNAVGNIQIDGSTETGHPIAQGFSGTPVWSDKLKGVVGMVASADTRLERKTAFAIPSMKLVDAIPFLVPRTLPSKIRRNRTRIEFTLPFNLTDKNFKDKEHAIKAAVASLAAVLEIDPGLINVLQVTLGSIKIAIEMPHGTAVKLFELNRKKDKKLARLGIQNLKLIGGYKKGIILIPASQRFSSPIKKIRTAVSSLARIEGIGPVYADRLVAAGVTSTMRLLEKGADSKGRKWLSKNTGISERLILEWVNLADLMRIRGVGQEYSDLLEGAGVDTVRELRNRNPTNLHQALIETNAKKNLVRRVPSLGEVEKWVTQAKNLSPKVKY
jgi:predicted flap endonuclease-1-like 5' DNA nuclease